jgi:hypothetical protein
MNRSFDEHTFDSYYCSFYFEVFYHFDDVVVSLDDNDKDVDLHVYGSFYQYSHSNES